MISSRMKAVLGAQGQDTASSRATPTGEIVPPSFPDLLAIVEVDSQSTSSVRKIRSPASDQKWKEQKA